MRVRINITSITKVKRNRNHSLFIKFQKYGQIIDRLKIIELTSYYQEPKTNPCSRTQMIFLLFLVIVLSFSLSLTLSLSLSIRSLSLQWWGMLKSSRIKFQIQEKFIQIECIDYKTNNSQNDLRSCLCNIHVNFKVAMRLKLGDKNKFYYLIVFC